MLRDLKPRGDGDNSGKRVTKGFKRDVTLMFPLSAVLLSPASGTHSQLKSKNIKRENLQINS